MRLMYQVQLLLDLAEKILIEAGFPRADARLIVDSLVQADCNGISTHGLSRLNLYLERAEKGVLNKTPEIKVIRENISTVLIDADNGMAVLACKKAVDLITEKAKSTGIAMAAIRHSNHLGALSYVADLISQKGMIGFVSSNTSPIMAPHGGKEPVLGNNPFSISIPFDPPIIFDTALSITARGNIILAEREGKPIPEGWAINKEGQITTDAKEALLGAVLPLAGHKGYGMALIIDILSGVLTGSAYGTEVGSFVPPDYSKPLDFGHILLAINIESFMDRELFNKRLAHFISMIKESKPAHGFSEILIPGEGRMKRNAASYEKGIELQKSTVEKLKELCGKYHIEQDIF